MSSFFMAEAPSVEGLPRYRASTVDDCREFVKSLLRIRYTLGVVSGAHVRIGALSRRVGVKPELLRAWEQRYGLLKPVRSPGGFRLYSAADEERVRAMRRHLSAGLAAAEAARLALAETAEGPSVPLDVARRLHDELRSALDRLDESAANAAFDRLLGALSLESLLRDVVLPYLRDLGDRWERGDATVAQEHFASNLLRGRLLGLSRGWGRAARPAAVLACAPGELHDLPLIAFGLVLAARGWRIAYLGPDTPASAIADSAADVRPRLVVVSAVTEDRLLAVGPELAKLAESVVVALGGRGATEAAANAGGAVRLAGDPVTAAESADAEYL
jgi:DNA-binding transcriptional MerR regulator